MDAFQDGVSNVQKEHKIPNKVKTLLLAALLFPAFTAIAQTSDHASGVDARGDQAMGFSHQMTAHHFILLPDGGLIIANANDPKDEKSREEIRQHMEHIAKLFSAGDFNLPMFIHDQVPPGVPEMKKLSDDIQYEAPTHRERSSGADHYAQCRSRAGGSLLPPLPDRGPSNRRSGERNAETC